jgi:hypothetical protein
VRKPSKEELLDAIEVRADLEALAGGSLRCGAPNLYRRPHRARRRHAASGGR